MYNGGQGKRDYHTSALDLFPPELTNRSILQTIDYRPPMAFVAAMDPSGIVGCVKTVDPRGDVAAPFDAPGKVFVAGEFKSSPLFLQCGSHRGSSFWYLFRPRQASGEKKDPAGLRAEPHLGR